MAKKNKAQGADDGASSVPSSAAKDAATKSAAGGAPEVSIPAVDVKKMVDIQITFFLIHSLSERFCHTLLEL